MRPSQTYFLQRITALRGLLVSAATLWLNIAVITHTISAFVLRAPLTLSRAALAAALTGMPFTGNAAFTINTFAKVSA